MARGDGFVAVRDIAPKADTHLLVIPERHVESFREIDEFSPEEAKRMLEFVADVRATQGLEDYNVLVNVGRRRRADGLPPALARARRAGQGLPA